MVLKEVQPEPDEQVILIADADDTSRRMMSDVLSAHGYSVMLAQDGGSAMSVVSNHNVILSILDEHMSPLGGFEFIRQLDVNEKRMPLLMVTRERTTDLLTQATRHGVPQVLEKPVNPERLAEAVRRVLRAHKVKLKQPASQLVAPVVSRFTPDELMARAVALALQNKKSGMGGPFGAVVANAEGEILGEGTNNIVSHTDPLAYAEAMAIRQAAEKVGSHRLEGCSIFCSVEPSMMGQALIFSTGLSIVYFALEHEEVAANAQKSEPGAAPTYAQPEFRRILQDKARQDLIQE